MFADINHGHAALLFLTALGSYCIFDALMKKGRVIILTFLLQLKSSVFTCHLES